MSAERITVSLPADVREAVQVVAAAAGIPVSALVSEAITTLLRTRLVDAWLVEYQAEHGAFSEDELRRTAIEAGVTYLPPVARPPAA